MSDREDSRDGPVEGFDWPSELMARVVRPGPEPRVHGYDVESDLARHYSLAEQAFLAATGTLPDRETGRAVEVALTFLSPSTVGEAPAHAGLLARLCGATTAACLAAAALTLAEQTRELVASLAADDAGDAPSAPLASIERLRAALPPRFAELPGLARARSAEAAALQVLRACGARSSEQLELLVVWARLPTAASEALAIRPGSFREYPMDLPQFRYGESDE